MKRLNITDIEFRIKRSRQTIWRDYKNGKFPEPHYIGNRRFWYENQIENWESENIRTTPSHINLPQKLRPLPCPGSEQKQ